MGMGRPNFTAVGGIRRTSRPRRCPASKPSQKPRPRVPDHRRRARRGRPLEVLGKDVGKDAQHLTVVKLVGVEDARKLSEELVETLAAVANLGPAAAPLRELAVLVRDRVK